MVMNKSIFWLSILGIGLMQGCAETTTGTNDDNGGNTPLIGKSDAAVNDQKVTPVIGGTVYYTGYDGVNNYDIFIATSRNVTVHDPSVATAIKLTASDFPSITEAKVASQIAALEQVYTNFGETMSNRRKSFWERRFKNPSVWKISPVGPGITTISAESQRRTESIWENAEIRTIYVSEYTPQQVQQGMDRYTNGNGGNNGFACSTCHKESFFQNTATAPSLGDTFNAPPHLLGRVIEINDADAAKWISTGAVKDRVVDQAKYQTTHDWSFTSEEQKFATVAYLRSKQTTDADAFAELLYQEEIEETTRELQAELDAQNGVTP